MAGRAQPPGRTWRQLGWALAAANWPAKGAGSSCSWALSCWLMWRDDGIDGAAAACRQGKGNAEWAVRTDAVLVWCGSQGQRMRTCAQNMQVEGPVSWQAAHP
jgi:hypothetical protein